MRGVLKGKKKDIRRTEKRKGRHQHGNQMVDSLGRSSRKTGTARGVSGSGIGPHSKQEREKTTVRSSTLAKKGRLDTWVNVRTPH